MIPDKLVEFLHGPAIFFLGTRNEELRTSVSWAFGVIADPESDRVTIFVPTIENEEVLKDLKTNGMVALSTVDGATHEAYQLKGKYVEIRPTNEREKAVQEIHRTKAGARLVEAGMPPAMYQGFVMDPSVAVTFEVEEIFMQTPGPGAGDKLEL